MTKTDFVVGLEYYTYIERQMNELIVTNRFSLPGDYMIKKFT